MNDISTNRQSTADGSARGDSSGGEAPVDYSRLIDRCLGNLEFADRVLNKFRTGFTAQIEELVELCSTDHAEKIARLAHRLKGEAAQVSAQGLSRVMAEVEQLGREQKLEGLPGCLDRLRREWSRFLEYSATRPMSADP